jgi:hypothetical protein
MASLTDSTVSGLLQTNGVHFPSGESMTEWYPGYHCAADPSNWMHIRTPIPADASAGVGWIPYMLEFKGYHTYSGEYAGRWGAIVNTTGDGNNSWYGSQIKYNMGNYTPYVYRSDNTYGGYRRMCFSVQKVSCCCNGWWWARVNMNHQFRASHPWGQTGTNSQTTAAF